MTPRRWLLAGGLVIAVLAIGGAAVLFGRGAGSATVPSGPITLDSCNGTPPFATDAGMIDPVFTTATRESQGLVVIFDNGQGQQGSFVHPSYGDAGDLGTITISPNGEVFTVPRPAIDVLENPAEERNTIFRVDPETGVLSAWAELPLVHEPLDQPFGIMGLAVDCTEPFLYATSLTGTTPEEEGGSLWRIDRRTREAELIYEGFDATSIAVGSSLGRRVLVIGAARTGALYVAPVTDQLPAPALLSRLEGVGATLSVRAIKLRPDTTAPVRMVATVIDFDFSLRAQPAQATQTITFEWEPEGGYRQVG